MSDSVNEFNAYRSKMNDAILEDNNKIIKRIFNLDTNAFKAGALDTKTKEKANALMEEMQNKNLGYLAVSLGFYKTLFSAPGLSTSSEIPEEERESMGLSDGLVRISIGLDNDIERTYETMVECMKKVSIL